MLYSTLSGSQNSNSSFIFEYITAKEGLSHNYVSKVVSDSLNVKWIATENGVTKYDGSNYSHIRPGKTYPGLKNENIETLFVDSHNLLWIGTKSGGLSCLDIKSHRLTNYNKILSDNSTLFRIRTFQEDDMGNIWVMTNNNGMFVIDPKQKKTIKHFNTPLSRFLTKDSEGNIWFGSNWDLKSINPKTHQITTYKLGDYASTLIEDTEKNCLWIGTVNYTDKHHLLRFDLETKEIAKHYTDIPNSFTSTLYLDQEKCLWIGTWGSGLYRGNKDFTSYKEMDLVHSSGNQNKMNYQIILDIHEDANKVLWISSDFGGVVKLEQSKGFKNLSEYKTDNESLKGVNIQSIFKDAQNLYLGTLRNGLFYGKDVNSLKQYKGFKNKKIYQIGRHKNNVIIGTNQYIHLLDKTLKPIKKLPIEQATCFYTWTNKKVWVGTQQNGLYVVNLSNPNTPRVQRRYRPKNEKYNLNSTRITAIVKDSNENIWLGTYNGLHLYNKITEQFIPYQELTTSEIPDIINTIYTDTNNIWLGTPNGVYKLSYVDGKLKVLDIFNSELNGLENDFICGIKADKHGFLWLTTSTSLIRFEPFNKSFVNFSESDGIYASFYNIRTIYNDHLDNIIYAGGTDNLTYFNPELVTHTQNPNQLIFSELKVDNERVKVHDTIYKNIILKKDLNYTKKLEFSHLEKSISISFGSTNFTTNSNLHYKYRLTEIDKNWQYLKHKNEINFIGLAPGNYKLEVAASKDFKVWSSPIIMEIKVNYAPWASPLAFGFYFLIALAVILFFISISLKQFRMRNKLDKEQELSEAKLTFFTNISHEFRTPLTLILSPLKELIQQKMSDPELNEKLFVMEKNADRLLNLITQLLDFRKAEHGLLSLHSSNGNIVNFSKEVFLYFKEQAKSKKITYDFSSNKKEIMFPFDRNKMEIVLCNLISNALKYTFEGDTIILEVKQEENWCIISVKDTGIGMKRESTAKIFDRFYQINSTTTSDILGSGIGLSFTKKIIELHGGTISVNSKINKGTEFIIDIPLNEAFEMNIKTTQHEAEQIEDLINEDIDNLQIESKENTVLIVDDNDDIRNYLSQLLKREYNILNAADGVEAIEVASKEIPDLILCDIMMPKKDGLEVSVELKSQVTTSHIPIILLTARSSNMYEIKGLETGADDFISKPFDPQVVKARIASALQNRGKIREHFLNKVRFQPTENLVKVSTNENTFIDKAIQLVEDNLTNENFDLKMMQDKLFMSQSSLYRKIKSLTGLSLTGFIRSIRLKKAAEIILKENEKLSSVAAMVGFNDYKHFRESFKKQFNCLPSDYRDQKTN